jgi:hypothetical protein
LDKQTSAAGADNDSKSPVSTPGTIGIVAAAMSPGLEPSSQRPSDQLQTAQATENNVQAGTQVAAAAPSSPVPLPRSKRKAGNSLIIQTSLADPGQPRKAPLPVTAESKEQEEQRKPQAARRPPPLVGTADRTRKKGI